MCKKDKSTLKKFRKDCLELDSTILELLSKFKSYKGDKKPSEIFDDYDVSKDKLNLLEAVCLK